MSHDTIKVNMRCGGLNLNRDKEELKKWMVEAHGSEIADALFAGSPEVVQRIKERTKAVAENSRQRHSKKTFVVQKVNLDRRLNGRTVINENGDRVIYRKAKRK